MTHEEVMEQVKKKIARWLFTFVRDRESLKLNWEQTKGYYLQEADKLLSDVPEILIKNPDQTPPHIAEKDVDGLPVGSWLVSAGIFAQQDMLKEHWVKVLPKEEK